MKEANRILEKYRRGECTAEELDLLYKWFEEIEQDPSHELSDAELREFERTFKKNFYAARHDKSSSGKWSPWSYRKLVAACAVGIAAVLLLAFFLVFFVESSPQIISVSTEIVHQDISPGGHKATLTLGNGKTIVLSDTHIGESLVDGRVTVLHSDSGLLVYQEDLSLSGDANDSETHNIIETPQGGIFSVLLPDGTRVFLNSATRIKYPIHFDAETRVVELLEGEAYFEVKPRVSAKYGKQPFIVKTANEEIEVLGTAFNVSSYPNEKQLTTLIEGSIQIGTLGSTIKTRIFPGQQLYFQDGRPQVVSVEPESVYAWKDGYFLFDDETLEDIMRKVARWYDLTVEYGVGVDKKGKFWGSVSRFENVSILLEKLELTGAVKFEIKGRRVLVMK